MLPLLIFPGQFLRSISSDVSINGLKQCILTSPIRTVQCRLLSSKRRRKSSSLSKSSEKESAELDRENAVHGLESRSALKLFLLDDKYQLIQKGMWVLDLGYAPGAWTRLAVDKVFPNGRILGVDLLPCPPPPGASTIQGNIFSQKTHQQIKDFFKTPYFPKTINVPLINNNHIEIQENSYIETEKIFSPVQNTNTITKDNNGESDDNACGNSPLLEKWETKYPVDIILSDLSEYWPQTNGYYLNTINDPYLNMAIIPGMAIRDHAHSIDACDSALLLAVDLLIPKTGKFICRIFDGSETKYLKERLQKLFKNVYIEKLLLESKHDTQVQRNDIFLIGIGKREGVSKSDIFS